MIWAKHHTSSSLTKGHLGNLFCINRHLRSGRRDFQPPQNSALMRPAVNTMRISMTYNRRPHTRCFKHTTASPQQRPTSRRSCITWSPKISKFDSEWREISSIHCEVRCWWLAVNREWGNRLCVLLTWVIYGHIRTSVPPLPTLVRQTTCT